MWVCACVWCRVGDIDNLEVSSWFLVVVFHRRRYDSGCCTRSRIIQSQMCHLINFNRIYLPFESSSRTPFSIPVLHFARFDIRYFRYIYFLKSLSGGWGGREGGCLDAVVTVTSYFIHFIHFRKRIEIFNFLLGFFFFFFGHSALWSLSNSGFYRVEKPERIKVGWMCVCVCVGVWARLKVGQSWNEYYLNLLTILNYFSIALKIKNNENILMASLDRKYIFCFIYPTHV